MIKSMMITNVRMLKSSALKKIAEHPHAIAARTALCNVQMTSETCPLCERVLGEVNVDEHHLIPKTFKGKVTVRLHKICHRKIHATFSERELLHDYFTIEALKSHETIKTFVKWVARKDPGFYDGTKDSNERKAKRRR